MTALYGPTFGDEVIAAGLGGLPFSWSEMEIFGRENLTPEQSTQLDTVVAAHDPTKQPEKTSTPEQQVLFDHENRIRAQEGQPPLSQEDFAQKVKTK